MFANQRSEFTHFGTRHGGDLNTVLVENERRDGANAHGFADRFVGGVAVELNEENAAITPLLLHQYQLGIHQLARATPIRIEIHHDEIRPRLFFQKWIVL